LVVYLHQNEGGIPRRDKKKNKMRTSENMKRLNDGIRMRIKVADRNNKNRTENSAYKRKIKDYLDRKYGRGKYAKK